MAAIPSPGTIAASDRIDLIQGNPPLSPAGIARIAMIAGVPSVSINGGAYASFGSGAAAPTGTKLFPSRPLPSDRLDIVQGNPPVSPTGCGRLACIAGAPSLSIEGAAFASLGSAGAAPTGTKLSISALAPTDYIDIIQGNPPVSLPGTMRLACFPGASALSVSVEGGAYATLAGIAPPGSPFLWFDAQNIDGTNNSSLTDGQQIGTWLNLGSYGGAANLVQATAGLRPLFTKTAPVLTGKSCLTSDGTKQMQTAAFTVTAVPVTWIAIARQTGVGAKVVISGASGLAHQIGTNPLIVQVFAGSVVSTGQSIVANAWHQLGFVANGAASTASLDGTTTGALAAGSGNVSSLSAFGDGVGGELMIGTIAEIIAYSGALGGQPTLAALTAYISAKYGPMPQ